MALHLIFGDKGSCEPGAHQLTGPSPPLLYNDRLSDRLHYTQVFTGVLGLNSGCELFTEHCVPLCLSLFVRVCVCVHAHAHAGNTQIHVLLLVETRGSGFPLGGCESLSVTGC